MSSPALLMAALAGLVSTSVAAADPALRTDLERVARQRVYFGHQSVGANLLQGVEELAAQAGVPGRIVRAEHASELPAATFVHTFIPENGKPLEKLESFRRALVHVTLIGVLASARAPQP